MPIDLQFVGGDSFPLLYRGDSFRTLVKLPVEGAQVQESAVVPRVEVFEKQFCFGFVQDDQSDVIRMQGGITTGGDLLAAFRCALLLQEVPIINSDSLHDVSDCVIKGKDGDAKRRAGNHFINVMRMLPPELGRALLLSADMGVGLHADSYIPLIDAATLTLNDELRLYGLESTADRAARQSREAEALALYQPVITAFQQSQHPEVVSVFGGVLRGFLLQVLSRDVRDPVIAAAWAVFKTESRFLLLSGNTIDGLLLKLKGSDAKVEVDPIRIYRQRQVGLKKGAELAKLLLPSGDRRTPDDIIAATESLDRRILRLATRTI